MMTDKENESATCKCKEIPDTHSESPVKILQSSLFHPPLSTAGSYFSNFLAKSPFEEDSEAKLFRVKESNSKEWLTTNKELGFTLQSSRWPTECQVLEQRVAHINDTPPTFEPYYIATGAECQPKPSGEECGTVVFHYTPISAVNYFSRSSVGGSRYIISTHGFPQDECLRFESRFESGNLAKAIMITPNYYELHLRADMYTNRHMQWFYFKISNVKKDFLYRFSITNFSKESSLYSEGMKPLMYSTKDSQLHSIGWRRCGENISYFCNDNVTPEDADQQMTYTLTFTIRFPHDDDDVYLAHCYPYTYSDLQDYLSELSSHPVKSTFSTVRLLCKTLAGNNVYYVTVTSPTPPGDTKKKRAIVVTARVHPGETPSSWMMKGVLDFLTSDSAPAKELRDKFVFKVVPMLNPDGVIVGNNRCSLSAKDLNRQYRTVIRDAYPSIWYTKLMVRRLLEDCGVTMYCDFHAHSRKHNVFLYGCENRRVGDRRLQEQVFPLMLHKNSVNKFSFESCKFRIQKSKEGTGRVVMWMMGIANSYTMEASFAGSTMSNRADTHFSTTDYEQMGKSFCQTLLDFYDEDPKKERLRLKIIERLALEGSNADEPANITLSDYSSDEGDTSSSDEVGRDDSPMLNGPPPSPIVKATLKLSLSDKDSCTSTSSSDSDEEIKEKSKKKRKKRKYRKKKKKKKHHDEQDYFILLEFQDLQDSSDGEIRIRKSTRTITVFDLIPADSLKSQFYVKRPRTPQHKRVADKKSQITVQLAEVQAKLFTLKNKMWFGTGNGDAPISWGSDNYFSSNKSTSLQKKKKVTRKTASEKKPTSRESKIKFPHKEKQAKTSKNQNGLKRQAALEWSASQDQRLPVRKTKSLLDTSSLLSKKSLPSGDEEKEKPEGKKKKRRPKLQKKVKEIVNAKLLFNNNKD